MASLDRGLYETLITESLEKQLGDLDKALEPIRSALRAPEAADRIALHLAREIERAVNSIAEGERAKVGLDLARRLIDLMREMPAGPLSGSSIRSQPAMCSTVSLVGNPTAASTQ